MIIDIKILCEEPYQFYIAQVTEYKLQQYTNISYNNTPNERAELRVNFMTGGKHRFSIHFHI